MVQLRIDPENAVSLLKTEMDRMDISTFYSRTGGDFEDVMKRLMRESRVEKYVRMFPDDPSFRELESNLAQNKTQEAFRAAHTLKGVCMNLSFTKLFESSKAVTESLRHADLDNISDMEKVAACMEPLRKDYRDIIEAIKCLDS